ncbi:MAG: SH3 domain-containing C40 family peptidase [Eubacteriales bacterium]|nr:SH3 domain-containing C40 family peptidase [Eubacteriales bacterium]
MNQGMKKHVMRAAACFAVGSMTMAGFSGAVSAAGTGLAGLDKAVITAQAEKEVAADTAEQTQEQKTVAPAENVINTFAVAQIGDDSYINIRTAADADSEIVGKLYHNNVATIIGEEGEWYRVQSGNCEGYVAKYLLTTGSEAAAVVESVGTQVAQVNAEALMVRADASEDAEVVDMVTADQIVYLEEDLGGWAKVSTDNATGYVSADYVSYATYLPQAESVEEEAARIEAEEAAYAEWLAEQERLYEEEMARQQAEWEAQNQAWIEYLQSQGSYADEAQATADQAADAAAAQQAADEAALYYDEETAAAAQAAADEAAMTAANAQAEADAANQAAADYASQVLADAGVDASTVAANDGTSSARQAIVDYALQFVGNPYVWGGTSLTNGADCSGFTQSVMADNGISINRTAGAQSQGGTSVSLSDIQPGDLLFYSGSGDYGIGHVSMYIGNGQVVHASNSTDGIIVSDINYRTPVSAKSYIN